MQLVQRGHAGQAVSFGTLPVLALTYGYISARVHWSAERVALDFLFCLFGDFRWIDPDLFSFCAHVDSLVRQIQPLSTRNS